MRSNRLFEYGVNVNVEGLFKLTRIKMDFLLISLYLCVKSYGVI